MSFSVINEVSMKKQTAEFSVNSQEEKNLLGTADALFCKYLAEFCDIYTEMAEYEMDEDPMYDILHTCQCCFC